jgi:hypothetical protein
MNIEHPDAVKNPIHHECPAERCVKLISIVII